MLKWLSSTSNNVFDTFAPLFRSNLEQFQDAWRKVQDDFGHIMGNKSGLDDPELLANSSLIPHLNQLVEALVKEEEEQTAVAQANGQTMNIVRSGQKTGPCFEYFLQEKVLDTLCALGLPDRPMGMRHLITKTIDAILLNTRHPILPSMSVHMPLRQFLDICVMRDDMKNKRTRSGFVSLLHTICLKIRDDNSLAGIFFDESQRAHPTRTSNFLIFSSLLSLLSEPGSAEDVRMALEGMLWCVQVPNERISLWVTQETNFISKLIETVDIQFGKFPPILDIPPWEDLMLDPFVQQFFDRLSYVDAVCLSTYERIATPLAEEFKQQFLIKTIQPLLLDVREDVARWTTYFIERLVRMLDSVVLRHTIVDFLLGTDNNPELAPVTSNTAAVPPTTDAPTEVNLRSTLIKRIDSLSEPLSIATLELFASLIGTRSRRVLDNLLIRNLIPLNHIVPSSVTEYTSLHDILHIPRSSMFSGFTEMFDVSRSDNYDEYLMDSQLEGQRWIQSWEDEKVILPEQSTEQTFYEGLFLQTLLNKFENLYENSFTTNLRLTSVLAKLCHCPVPIVHCYLFDPSIPCPPTVRLVLHVLAEVWNRGRKRALKMPNFEKRKLEIRNRLNAGLNGTFDDSELHVTSGVETMDVERFFQGIIVLEEFVKEWLSICETKTRLYGLAKLARLEEKKTNNDIPCSVEASRRNSVDSAIPFQSETINRTTEQFEASATSPSSDSQESSQSMSPVSTTIDDDVETSESAP